MGGHSISINTDIIGIGLDLCVGENMIPFINNSVLEFTGVFFCVISK